MSGSLSFFKFFFCFSADGIGHCRFVKRRIVKMGVYLRCVQIAVAKDLLERAGVDAVFQHKRGGCVAQLMRRITAGVKPGLKQLFIDHFLHAADAYTADVAADEQRVFVLWRELFAIADSKIVIDSFSAAVGKEHNTLLVAFAEDTEMILVYIRGVQRDELRNAQAA